ncbi:MAG TPA: sulfite oxidase [Candidatus Limnocylindrales bacterium]|nr:sulfite oxidase [Candidatus Limnocylindrales bacterium]
MIRSTLVVRRAQPFNAEAQLATLADHVLTPNERFYVRNHFPVPRIDARRWRLTIRGLVDTPLEVSLRMLREMRSRALAVTLECAGNGRSFFRPAIEGEPWVLGAVSTARWGGVLLSALLDRAGMRAEATHLVFRGADGAYERGLSLDEARGTPVLLAYSMNGDPLPAMHGGPVRLIVPGWYGVASVKWLGSVEVTDRPFAGRYQTDRYVYAKSKPVTLMRVRSLISRPEDGAAVRAGIVNVRGLAWSGSGGVRRVEVSVEGGAWRPARLTAPKHFAWQSWRHTVRIRSGQTMTLRSCATDASGETQPEHAEWNALGYGNNSIQTVTVRAG